NAAARRRLERVVGRLGATPQLPPRNPQERFLSNGPSSAASPALGDRRTKDRCSSQTEDRAPRERIRAVAVLGAPSRVGPAARRYGGGCPCLAEGQADRPSLECPS